MPAAGAPRRTGRPRLVVTSVSDTLPRPAAAVFQAGRLAGLDLEVREFPDGTRTAAEAAQAVGCTVDQIVKSLVFVADATPVLVLTSGGNRVDEAKVARRTGAAAVRKADADEARAATGYAIGGTPPHVFPISPAALLRVSGGQVADVAAARGA